MQPIQINTLSNNWQRWLEDNINNGSSDEYLAKTLLSQHISTDVVWQTIRQARNAMAVTALVSPVSRSTHKTPYQNAHNGNFSEELSHFPTTPVIQTSDCQVNILVRHTRPTVVVMANLLSEPECLEIIALGAEKLKRSTVANTIDDANAINPMRTSRGTWLPVRKNALISRLNRRLSELTGLPEENGEHLNLLRYEIGEEYKPHFDYFDPAIAHSQSELARGGQRYATLIIYLNDVEAGGETIFPELGLAVTPRRGHAVYFEYSNSQNQLDWRTLHGGSPVRKGEKWIVTKWFRRQRFQTG